MCSTNFLYGVIFVLIVLLFFMLKVILLQRKHIKLLNQEHEKRKRYFEEALLKMVISYNNDTAIKILYESYFGDNVDDISDELINDDDQTPEN